MMYLKITDNSLQAQAFEQYLRTLPFVEILEIEPSDDRTEKELLNDLKKSFTEVREKKTKPLTMLLNAK